MSLWKRFTEPLPMARKWSVLIRLMMYGWPIAVLVLWISNYYVITGRQMKPHMALAVCTELEQAIQRYYDDNGTLPLDIQEDAVIATDSEEGVMLLELLIGQPYIRQIAALTSITRLIHRTRRCTLLAAIAL